MLACCGIFACPKALGKIDADCDVIRRTGELGDELCLLRSDFLHPGIAVFCHCFVVANCRLVVALPGCFQAGGGGELRSILLGTVRLIIRGSQEYAFFSKSEGKLKEFQLLRYSGLVPHRTGVILPMWDRC